MLIKNLSKESREAHEYYFEPEAIVDVYTGHVEEVLAKGDFELVKQPKKVEKKVKKTRKGRKVK